MAPSPKIAVSLVSLALIVESNGFSINKHNHRRIDLPSSQPRDFFGVCTSTASTTRIRMSILGDDEKKLGEDDNWDGFNPFERQKTQTQLNPVLASSTISLRQMRMKELMSKLLASAAEETEAINSILEDNAELILQPLVEEDGVMEPDSIYTPGMTREERFDRYEEVMNEREAKAVNKSVHRILGLMRDFVATKR